MPDGVLVEEFACGSSHVVVATPERSLRSSQASELSHARSDTAMSHQTGSAPIEPRLTPMGRRAGLVTDARWEAFECKQRQYATLKRAIESHRNGQWLKRPEARIGEIRASGWPVAAINLNVKADAKWRNRRPSLWHSPRRRG